jgi:hypothetical protein
MAALAIVLFVVFQITVIRGGPLRRHRP